jgi:hypothetical protein
MAGAWQLAMLSCFVFYKEVCPMKPGHLIIAGVGLVLSAWRWFTIADDAWMIINDPRQANKPGEVLKLFFDFLL